MWEKMTSISDDVVAFGVFDTFQQDQKAMKAG
jgi:hypothetical protein